MTVHALNIFPQTKRHAVACSFKASDGTNIFYRHWPAVGVHRARGAVLLLHRGHEHGGRMAHLVEELQLQDFDIYAWDARGHGRSEGARGAAPAFSTLVRDLDDFAGHIRAADGWASGDISLVAESVGAVIASTWVHDYAPQIRGMVLAAPAFEANLFLPGARSALRLWQALRGTFTVNSYVQPWMLTHDTARRQSYLSDPLISPSVASNVLLGLYETGRRLVADAAAIDVPTQVMIPGSDWVARAKPQHAFFQGIAAETKELRVYPNMRHDVLGEEERGQIVGDARRFLLDCYSRPIAARTAHRLAAVTEGEANALAKPLPKWSWGNAKWKLTKAALRVGAAFSKGLRLGQQSGFDSGATLDYVYRDTAEGTGPLGRMLDRLYLNSVGWRGIRARKAHAEELINEAVERLAGQGAPLRVADIAAGHGRYVLDGLARAWARPESVVLRDYCPNNVASGRDLIAKRGLSEVARFERADAFDKDCVASLNPRPTLAIVSGLYELFDDNAPISASLAGLAEAIPAGGMLVYTNQPWHPQLEMIARSLTSHRGGIPWVMRRRTQAEMDQLVADAGFRKLTQRIDKWGIFTVSLAIREG